MQARIILERSPLFLRANTSRDVSRHATAAANVVARYRLCITRIKFTENTEKSQYGQVKVQNL